MFNVCHSKMLTPLHQAVIGGDETAFAQYVKRADWHEVQDACGLTPLDLAQLLGRYSFQRSLGGVFPEKFSIQLKGSGNCKELSVDEFEKEFGIIYRPFLTFSSYEQLKRVISNCPYILRSHYLAEENYKWGHLYKKSIREGALADVYVKWIDEQFGYGLFAAKELSAGTFVGEYTGLVRALSRRHPDHNGYCLHYPTRLWSWNYFAIDALHEGNLTRFINHSDEANLHPLCTITNELLHQIFVTKAVVKQGMQLTFDYGVDYWQRRHKLPLATS